MKNKLIPILLVIATFWSCTISFGQVDKKSGDEINWMTWSEVEDALKKEKKKVFVDVYTDWCGYCKKMDKTTFKDKEIIKYINENFYAVKFDAENKETITLDGNKYKYVKSGKRGYNQLAADLLKGRLSYPTIVFLNDDLSLIQPIPGYLDANKMEVIVTYFAENNHKKTPWTRYEKGYVPMKNRTKLKVKKKSNAQLALPGKN
ncbi:MAG: thioredoxin family protein [Saprospiraceae bacterium]